MMTIQHEIIRLRDVQKTRYGGHEKLVKSEDHATWQVTQALIICIEVCFSIIYFCL